MHVCFVCSTNTCRSAMAALVFREHLSRSGLDGRVRVTSAGTGLWQAGAPVDRRAAAVLAGRGYPTGHVATPLGSDHLNASLLLALDSGHARTLRGLVADLSRVRLLRSFDPAARDDVDVPDPYYGGPREYAEVLQTIETAVPALLDWVCARVRHE
ncbi:low molecular weight phosphotyrosine protein phosphatase [Amycolatopsis sp. NBC_00355]|uniref:low molecular weight protein-tyrosine-phosphatase n=1 Tax=Amycolatopsis sp. NBC_00355 TaxID=2975957 RepID=UPI002E25DE92